MGGTTPNEVLDRIGYMQAFKQTDMTVTYRYNPYGTTAGTGNYDFFGGIVCVGKWK